MSPLNIRALSRIRLLVVLALLCSGMAALALSNRVLSVSAESGDKKAKARAAFSDSELYVRDGVAPVWEYLFPPRQSFTVSNAFFAPTMQAETALRGTIGLSRGGDFKYAFSLNLETKVETRLDGGVGSVRFVRLSPNGEKVLFSSDNKLVIADADGKNPLIIPDLIPNQPNWSPDSQRIVFAGPDRLYIIDANGQNKRVVSWNRPSTAEVSNISNPSWSPDGSKIFYAFIAEGSDRRYYVDMAVLTLARNPDGTFILNPDGSIAVTSDVQLTFGNLGTLSPTLSPDGTKIAFSKTTRIEESAAYGDIFVMNADGSGVTQLTSSTPDYHNYGPVWSPDGTRIAFTRDINTSDEEIVAIKTDGSDLIRIPTGSPDDTIDSWIDPCAVPVSSPASSVTSKSVTSANQTTNMPHCSKDIIVNNTTDDKDKDTEGCDTDNEKDGPQCSLRAAIMVAEARSGSDTIKFEIPGGGVQTIAPTELLPEITRPVFIDGTSQPGYSGSPLIQLRGTAVSVNTGAPGIGLNFKEGSGSSKVAGLALFGWDRTSINIEKSERTEVRECFIGIKADGTAEGIPFPENILNRGIAINLSPVVKIAGNVISNNRTGIFINDSNLNQIDGNRIGTDKTGSVAIPNGTGINAEGSSHIINNLISGNKSAGIRADNSLGLRIANNLIGTKADGTGNLSNGSYGVHIEMAENVNIIGNTIVGHTSEDAGPAAGIFFNYGGGLVAISGNRIGVGKDGITPVPNKYGILIIQTTGLDVTENIISGNNESGIMMLGRQSPGVNNTVIRDNFIGTDLTKRLDIGNGKNGIWLDVNVQKTEILGNHISGNGENGILLSQETSNNLIHDNLIGVAAPNKVGINLLGSSNNSVFDNVVANSEEINISLGGLPPGDNTNFTEGNQIYGNQIENGKIGIALIEKARNNTIGVININGTGNIPNTIINHRNGLGAGIFIGTTVDVTNDDFLPNNNKIIGNRIGGPQSNAFSNKIGVLIAQAQNNFIGGQFSPLTGNFINANEQDGIRISGARTKGNLIGLNSIGINDLVFSDSRYGNGGNGISIDGAGRNDIRNNAIGYNRASGIYISNVTPQAGEEFSAIISGNQIGAGKFSYAIGGPGFKAGNGGFGIRINNSQKVLIGVGGNSSTEPRNVIAANASGGVLIEGLSSKLNIINNSIIGTTETGATDVGNTADGIYIFGGGENTIGGAASVGNVIAGNGGHGVVVELSVKNKIYGNHVGVFPSGGSNIKLGNDLNGILILNATETEIGRRFTSPLRNIIGGNTRSGIVIQGLESRLTNIKLNYIGTDSSRTNLGNVRHGILVTEGGRQVTVGGREDIESGNTIAFNNAAGILADHTAGNSIFIDPNTIFNNVGMGIDIGAPGPTPNDFGDADEGPNRLQNHPEIISRRLNSNNEFIISYRVTSAPGNSNYGTDGIYVEFFRTDAAGEGEKFLGADHYTVADYADGAANPREVNLGNITTLGINPNDRLTASASDADGNTSEFYGDTGSVIAGSVQLSASTYTVNEGAGTLEVTVTRTGPALGPVIASYVLTAGTATAGTDYTNSTGSVTFADGDLTSKTFNVQITNDTIQEPEESLKLTLFLTSGSTALGTPFESTITITDDEAVGPTLDSLSDLTITEDAPLQTINLSGISVGTAASQALSVTATSSNTSLIPNPSVSYISPNSTGSLGLTPVKDQSGSALITVTVTTADSTSSISRTFTVNVTAVNDAPLNIIPGAQSVNANGTLTFSAANGNPISISDIDAGNNNPAQVQMTATNGTLSLSTTAGLTFVNGDGIADATMTFTGTLTSINAALNGLVFTPTSNFTGAASLQIITNDQGNTGTGGALSDTDTVSISVGASTFQFSSATYTVGEAGGHVTITVTRSGDVSQPASINFQFEDLAGLTNCEVVTGTASQRCDFTAGGGTLNFSAGQTSATYLIFLIDDVYVEGAENLTLVLVNQPGDVAGTPSTATLIITDNDNTAGAPNPIDSAAFFMRQQYIDLLIREPEPEGLQFYLNILNGCHSSDTECIKYTRGALAANFFRSPEFKAKGSYVMYLYMVTLGQRPATDAELTDPTKVERPHYAEFMADVQSITSPDDRNGPDPAKKAALTAAFVQRPEIVAKYPNSLTDAQFAQALQQTAGVTLADQSVFNGKTRAEILRIIAESPEVNARFYIQGFVTMEYFGFLRRNPDLPGYVFHNNRYKQLSPILSPDLTENFIVRGFIESLEYRQRFGP